MHSHDLNPQSKWAAQIANARTLHLSGSFAAAKAIATGILRIDPNFAPAREVEALIEMEHGDLAQAVRLLKKICAQNPRDGIMAYNLGLAHRYAGNFGWAVEWLSRAVGLRPDLRRAHVELANTYANIGDFVGVETTCRAMMRQWPDDGQPYGILAMVRPECLTPADVARLAAMVKNPDISSERRANLQFAYADALRQRKQYDQAFAQLTAANATMVMILAEDRPATSAIAPGGEKPKLQSVPVAAEKHRILCDYMTATFDAPFLARFSGQGVSGARPIFVVGMPRSGSTLVEQILSSHPDVFGAGEVPYLSQVLSSTWPFAGEADARPDVPPTDQFFKTLGQDYLSRLMTGSAPRGVDKMLGNYLYVGMIHLCLPDAIVLDIRRDPMDNCLACFERQFRTGHEFTYDLDALAAQYRRYVAVMDHWDHVVPGRVQRISYEALVSDPDRQIPDLLARCDLPWDDAVTRFYDSKRPVRTASLSQVRRPISAASVQKWKPYAAHLTDLIHALYQP